MAKKVKLKLRVTKQKARHEVENVRRSFDISGLRSEEKTWGLIIEMFSPPRVCSHLNKMKPGNLKSGTSFDLRVNTDTGEKWDFLKAVDRRLCWRRLREENPWAVTE